MSKLSKLHHIVLSSTTARAKQTDRRSLSFTQATANDAIRLAKQTKQTPTRSLGRFLIERVKMIKSFGLSFN